MLLKGNKYLVIALATNMPKIVLITEAKIPTLILAKRASCNFVFFHIVTYLSNVQSVMGNCMYCDSLKEKRGKKEFCRRGPKKEVLTKKKRWIPSGNPGRHTPELRISPGSAS